MPPVPYAPSVETPEDHEAETTQQLIETLRMISETTLRDGGHAIRSVHAKSHGLLTGELHVCPDLPDDLAQGLFADERSYGAVLRFSTIPGDILPDSVSVPRGVGLKVLGVDGERLPGSEGATTQDFLMVDAPAFAAANAKAFLGNLKLLAKTTDKVEGLKKALSATLRGLETVLEAVGGQSGLLKTLGGHRATNVLGETYYTQVPLRYGGYIAKLSLAPSSDELHELAGSTVDLSDPNALREAVRDFFGKHDGEWELRAQLCTDLDTMPIENAATVWPEHESPYRTVARVTVPRQDAWSAARATAIDDGMAFSPWHGLAAHRPLGSVMRVRKSTYEMSKQFRGKHNGCPMHEPSNAAVSL